MPRLPALVALVLWGVTLHAAAALCAEPAEADATAGVRSRTPAPAENGTEDPATGTDQAPPPPNPFGGRQVGERPDALSGVIELSDGTRVPGDIYGTRGQGLLVLDLAREKNKWRRVPLGAILAVDTQVDWERMDREWRFKTAGDPEKVYTGKSYPNRRYSYRLTLRDETQIRCRIKGVPVYVRPTGDKPRLFVLHERHKGNVGTTLKDLIYVKAVRFGDELRRKVEEELRRKAEQEAARKAAQKAAEQDKPRPENAAGDKQGGDDGGGNQNLKDSP